MKKGEALFKQIALVKAANSIKQASTVYSACLLNA